MLYFYRVAYIFTKYATRNATRFWYTNSNLNQLNFDNKVDLSAILNRVGGTYTFSKSGILVCVLSSTGTGTTALFITSNKRENTYGSVIGVQQYCALANTNNKYEAFVNSGETIKVTNFSLIAMNYCVFIPFK